MERKYKIRKRIHKILAEGMCFFGTGLFLLSPVGEAALPTHPQPAVPSVSEKYSYGKTGNPAGMQAERPVNRDSGSRKQTGNAADRIWNDVRTASPSAGAASRRVTPGNGTEAVPARPVLPSESGNLSAGLTGYTEAEIRAQMVRRHTPPKAGFRKISGAAAGPDYRAGTLDVKIPALFFPPDEIKEVSETVTENPDGSFGVRAAGTLPAFDSSYGPAARMQLQEERRKKERKTEKDIPGLSVQQPPQGAGKGLQPHYRKRRTITVQVKVPAASPFRPLAKGEFRWFTNEKGRYVAVLPYSLPQDPLLGVPASGPMMIRTASPQEFMAVTADDPSDTYYYKNQNTFPTYGKALPIFTETRKNIQGGDVNIRYIRYFTGGQYCLIVESAGERAGKTYRSAVVFPESKQYEYLPKALYAIENLKAI